MSLKKYKMINMNWVDEYIDKMGVEKFIVFETRVNRVLGDLKVGNYYNIEDKLPEDCQELFIKFCCCYINQHPEYSFNENYTQIMREETYEQLKKRALDRRSKDVCQRQYRQVTFDRYL